MTNFCPPPRYEMVLADPGGYAIARVGGPPFAHQNPYRKTAAGECVRLVAQANAATEACIALRWLLAAVNVEGRADASAGMVRAVARAQKALQAAA